MDDFFQKIPTHPQFNLNLKPYEDGKIIKRIPKIKDTENIFKQMHPQNEFNFALDIMKAQQQQEQSNMQNAENVVTIYKAVETEQYFYIFMERCENSIYSEMKKYNGRIKIGDQQQIIEILYQIFKGYKFLQSINEAFIHRDLALDNLLFKIVDGKIIVKIADFGISKTDFTIQTSNINQKKLFLAPEFRDFTNKKKEQGKYSNQVDIYSLGMCLYLMMFNDVPIFDTDKGKLELNNIGENKLAQLIIDMTMQNYEKRITWDNLKGRIIHDHSIFHSVGYYTLLKENYDKQAFLKYAMLIMDYYKVLEGGVKVYKPFIQDNLIYLEQFQKFDHFIQMINQANDNESYLLIQVLYFEISRNSQILFTQTDNNNFQNLEILQVNQYFLFILQKASRQLQQDLNSQQQYQIMQGIQRRSSNPRYYNDYINTQLRDEQPRNCCLIM